MAAENKDLASLVSNSKPLDWDAAVSVNASAFRRGVFPPQVILSHTRANYWGQIIHLNLVFDCCDRELKWLRCCSRAGKGEDGEAGKRLKWCRCSLVELVGQSHSWAIGTRVKWKACSINWCLDHWGNGRNATIICSCQVLYYRYYE